MTIQEQVANNAAFTPHSLQRIGGTHRPMKFEHYANPMVHPITGETISSYKKLMHDPATAEVWQTAFGKDFGGMCQGDNKTGQKGTNAMFVMTHDEIAHTHQAKRVFTYGNPVVDHRPQKDTYRETLRPVQETWGRVHDAQYSRLPSFRDQVI